MASTFGSLEIAKSGMMAYNAALQTTAHNVANIETKGYSKQTVNMVSLVGNKTSATVQGFGVNVASITRNRNEYYDTKYQRTQSTYNYYQTQSYYLKALQDQICGNVTSDEKSRLTDAFDDFFSALSNLRGNANNSTIRRQAVTLGETFTDYVQNVATGLQKLQDEANTQVKTCVDQINAYAEKIVALNKQIDTVEAYGGIANDLRDQRSLLIDELSQYCDVETKEIPTDNGVGENQFYVYINGGTLVDTYKVNALVTKQKDTYVNINDITGLYDVSWADGSTFNMHSTAIGGVSVGAHDHGRIVDVNNALDGEGAFSPERAGGVPSGDLVKLCFSGEYTQQEVMKKLVGKGGFNAYIGSNDARDLEKMVNEGDEHAKLVQDAFYQQVAKDIGAMSTVLRGKVDQIILTGGIAYSEHTCNELKKRAGFIADFTVYPGEDELLALAQGALRVMNGEEKPMKY